MKRFLLTLVCVIIPFALIGCGGKAVEPPKGTFTDPEGKNTKAPDVMTIPKPPGQ